MKTPKHFITFLVLLLLSQGGFAQTARVGLKAGLNMAKEISKDSQINSKSKPGFHAAIYAHLPVAEGIFALQPELGYSGQGVILEQKGKQEDVSTSYGLVQLALKLYPAKGLNIQVAPYLSTLVSAHSTEETPGVPLENFYKFVDSGIGVGIGYEFSVGINLTARYNIGTFDISRDIVTTPNATYTSTSKDYNRVFQISIGFLIPGAAKKG